MRLSEIWRHVAFLAMVAVILWFVVVKPSFVQQTPPSVDWGSATVQSHETTPDLRR